MNRTETDYLVVHCSATPPSMDIGAEKIDEWHKERGWDGIGYHFVIRRDGLVELGRPLEAVGAHVRGYNYLSVGICMIGGVNESGESEDNFLPAQSNALLMTLTFLRQIYPTAEIRGHRDFPEVDKDCPSFDVQEWIHV
jgi:hypothetical protein